MFGSGRGTYANGQSQGGVEEQGGGEGCSQAEHHTHQPHQDLDHLGHTHTHTSLQLAASS